MIDAYENEILKHFIGNEKKYSYQRPFKKLIPYSAIIISRNRSPFPKESYIKNPLIWCIDSLIDQKILPQEIVLLNDFSDPPPADYTGDMVKIIEKKCRNKKIKFIYHVHQERKDAAIARNNAAKLTNNEILYFADDDIVARREVSWGIFLFDLVRKNDPNIFVLNLPQNNRASHPHILVSKNKMGKLNKNNLDVASNLVDRFPREYLENPLMTKLDTEFVFKPLILEHFRGGSVLISKEKLLKIGGFPDYGSPFSFGEETGLAIRGIKAGYRIYYFPYNNLSVVHMSYGNASGKQRLYGTDWLEGRKDEGLNLKQMVQESIKPKIHSGMRVKREVYYYVKIRNFAILFDELEKGLGDKWIKKSFVRFVEKNDVKFQDKRGIIEDKAIRKKIWFLARDHAPRKISFSEEELFKALEKVDG